MLCRYPSFYPNSCYIGLHSLIFLIISSVTALCLIVKSWYLSEQGINKKSYFLVIYIMKDQRMEAWVAFLYAKTKQKSHKQSMFSSESFWKIIVETKYISLAGKDIIMYRLSNGYTSIFLWSSYYQVAKTRTIRKLWELRFLIME